MTQVALSLKRSGFLLAAVLFTMLLMALNLGFAAPRTSAASLTDRKIELSSYLAGDQGTTATRGQALSGAYAAHTFTFKLATASTNYGSVFIQYCTTAIGTCTAPTGMDASTLTSVASQTGWTGGAWAYDSTTDFSAASAPWNTTHATCSDGGGGDTNGQANCIGLTRTAATDAASGTTVTLSFGTGGGTNYIKNPTAVGAGYFARIYIYGTNTYTTLVDNGTTAFAIVTPISITAKVRETLGFSVTATDSGNTVGAEGASCSALTGSGAIALGDSQNTLDIATAYDDYSYYRLFTNAASGVTVAYQGNTLEKGTDNINPATGEQQSTVGSEQFGLAQDADGNGVTGVDSSYGAAGQITLNTAYDQGDGTITNLGTARFSFTESQTTPTPIASATTYVTCDTVAVRYIANIAPTTPAGTYTTTIVYSAVPLY